MWHLLRCFSERKVEQLIYQSPLSTFNIRALLVVNDRNPTQTNVSGKKEELIGPHNKEVEGTAGFRHARSRNLIASSHGGRWLPAGPDIQGVY